jgi:hypothetical protein
MLPLSLRHLTMDFVRVRKGKPAQAETPQYHLLFQGGTFNKVGPAVPPGDFY